MTDCWLIILFVIAWIIGIPIALRIYYTLAPNTDDVPIICASICWFVTAPFIVLIKFLQAFLMFIKPCKPQIQQERFNYQTGGWREN